MENILFADYYKDTRDKGDTHIYVEQDFAYDEDGKTCLTNLYKIAIISEGKTVEKFEVLFGNFLECKKKSLKKCYELSLIPSFIIYDSNNYDNKYKDFMLKKFKI